MHAALGATCARAFNQSYGWASYALDKKKATFRNIEENVGLDHLRPYYQLACLPVHAGITSILYDLGAPEVDTLLLAGPSNRGLADP